MALEILKWTGLAIAAIILVTIVVLILNTLLVGIRRKKFVARKKIDDSKKNYAKELGQLIQCKTVSSRLGHNDTEFLKFRNLLEIMFPNIAKTAEKKIFSDGCIVYKINGLDKSRNIILMSHHDVVEALEGWSVPAFDGLIADGKLYGRGTVDTKTPLFAELKALDELLSEGFTPNINVYIASSHNEEILGDGMPTAVKYFKENNIKFELVLDEGGAIMTNAMPTVKRKTAMLAIHEKGRTVLKLRASASYGHFGLSPNKDTPIIRMAKFIEEIDRKKPFIKRLYSQTRATFLDIAPYMNFGMRFIFANIDFFWPIMKKILPKISSQAGTMLGTICYFTSISGGQYGQIQSKVVEATAFLRCVDKDDLNTDITAFKKIAKKYNIEVLETAENDAYIPTSTEQQAYKKVCISIDNIFSDVCCIPFILSAGSDARHFTDFCDCVVRFAPIDISPKQFTSVHNSDENIDVLAISEAVAFYKDLVKNYN